MGLILESALRAELERVVERGGPEPGVSDESLRVSLGQERSDPARLRALGIGADEHSLAIHLRQRWRWLAEKAIAFQGFCQQQKISPDEALPTLWLLWLPLAQNLAAQKKALGRPLVQGILGMQGAGKSTLGEALRMLLEPDYGVVNFSIDDLYKTYAERLELRQADPRLIWRGPPGTHDVALGMELLERCRSGPPGAVIEVPVFEKSCFGGQGDRTTPRPVPSPDIVLFDGWFVGARPVDPQAFATAPAPIVDDATRQFARDCNDRLREYLPLWEQLDGLIALTLTDYHLSKTWRMQAERKMRDRGQAGMSDPEIEQFVDYFWTALHPALFVEPLLQSGAADLVIEVGEGHRIQKIY